MPSFLTVTAPSLPTVMSSSVKFRSGLAFLTASLIFPCSSTDTFVGSATFTLSFGALTVSLVSSFSTSLYPVILSSEPSLYLIVAVPSLATLISVPSGKVL